MDEKLQWAIASIMEKVDPAFHGEFTLVFKAVVFQCMKTEQVLKPEFVPPPVMVPSKRSGVDVMA